MVLKKEIALQIKNLLKENPQGLSITDIVRVVDINRNTAGRYLENLLVSGQVEMRRLGMAKIYMLSQRVPLSAVLSISSELVIQLDSSLRIIFANEPFLKLVETDSKNLIGKNIEYSPVALIFDEVFSSFIKNIKEGITGKEWSGEIEIIAKGIVLFCRIAPTVFEDGRKGVSVIFEDITNRKKSEDALRESEERYRKLIDISPDAVFLHSEGKILFANPATVTLFGAAHPDQIIGINVLDFVHPDFREVVRKNIERDLIGEKTPQLELHMVRSDGSPFIVEGRGVRTSNGGKLAVQVALRDITESKRAEEALRESEGTFRSLVNESSDGIVIADEEGKVIVWNNALARISGIRESEAMGNLYIDLMVSTIVPEHRDHARITKIRKIVHEQLHTGASSYFFRPLGAEIIRKDGTRCYIQQTAFPIQTAKGYRIGSIIRDITEQKNIEKQLQKSEQLFKRLLEQSFDAIAVHKDGKIVFLNERAAKILGAAKPEELTGRPIFDFIHPESRKDLEDRVRKLGTAEGMAVPVIIEKFIRTDGTTVTVEVMAISFDDNGIPAFRVAFREIAPPERQSCVKIKRGDVQ